MHLGQVIKATRFSLQHEVDYSGTFGTTRLIDKQVLVIEPDSSLLNPIQFGNTWEKNVLAFKGSTNLYWQLFFELAILTSLPLDSLVIELKTTDPSIYSFLIYFDGAIKVNGPLSTLGGFGRSS